MSIVGAYLELPPGENPPWHSFSCWEEGEYYGKTPEGLDVVNWSGDYPDTAQVYLTWEPRVYAVWESGEENAEGTDGVEDGDAGEVPDAEPDEGAEQPGGVDAVVHAPEAEEQ